MRRRFTRFAKGSAAWVALLGIESFAPAAEAEMAEVVFSHPPQAQPVGGPTSDTLYNSPSFGPQFWQSQADDFALAADTVVGRVRWWGFHLEFVAPTTEDFRIRIHDASGAGGLPGGILSESINLNVSRMATGRMVVSTNVRAEYAYEADLTVPFSALAGQTYWFEVAQLGNVDSGFRWEFGDSSGGPRNGSAFKNPVVLEQWTSTLPGSSANMSFELLMIPEPTLASACLMGIHLFRLQISGRRGR